jgi:hypothetical protein
MNKQLEKPCPTTITRAGMHGTRLARSVATIQEKVASQIRAALHRVYKRLYGTKNDKIPDFHRSEGSPCVPYKHCLIATCTEPIIAYFGSLASKQMLMIVIHSCEESRC